MKKYLVIHHTAVERTKNPQLYAVNRYHRDKDWGGGWKQEKPSRLGWYVGYNYFNDVNGKVTQTRSHNEETIAQRGHNCSNENDCDAISHCLADDYSVTQEISEVQLKSVDKWVLEMKEIYPDVEVVGHRDLQTGRTCPMLDQKYFDRWNNLTPNDSTDAEKKKLIAELMTLVDRLRGLLALLGNR